MKDKPFKKDARYWEDEIRNALKWRQQYSHEERWPLFMEYYNHEYEDPTLPHFNLFHMLGNTLVPSLIFQRPGVLNTPRRPDIGAWAQFYDSVDGYLIDSMDVVDISERSVINSFLKNTSAVSIGYDFGTIGDEIEGRANAEGIMSVFKGVPGTVNRTRKQKLPWLDLVPSQRFLVAAGTKSMTNCRWFAKLIVVPVRLLKGERSLTNVKESHMPTEVKRHENKLWDIGVHGGETKGYIAYWEIHDAENKTWCWLSTDGGYIYKPHDDPLQVWGLPVEVLIFNRQADSIWGASDACYIESQMLESNEMRQFGRMQRKIALLKILYDSEAISQEQMDAFLTGAPGFGLPINRSGQDKLKDVIEIIQPHVQIEYLSAQKDILNDAQLISGHGPNQHGNFAPGRHTKYETQVVEGANTLRLSRRRAKMGEMIEHHLFRANILISRNWTQKEVQQVVGLDGALYWVEANPSQMQNLEDGLTTKVNVESMAPVSRERKKGEAMELIKLLGGFTEAGVNPLPLIQQLLSAFEWVDVRQVLPQMENVYSFPDFQAKQKELAEQGGLGTSLERNLGGISSLAGKYQSKGQNNDNDQSNEHLKNETES